MADRDGTGLGVVAREEQPCVEARREQMGEVGRPPQTGDNARALPPLGANRFGVIARPEDPGVALAERAGTVARVESAGL